MRSGPRIATALLGLVIALDGAGPARAAATTSGADTEPARALVALIGDAACDDDSQCRTIAMGAKACGGPAYYLAWSTKRTDAAALQQAARSGLTAHRNLNDDPGMRSDCMIVV